MSRAMIEVRGLSRKFENVQAVNDVSFTCEAGQVVGFIGANGAGKTTTMKMMATLDLPTEGEIRICGYETLNFPHEVRRRVGWMPDAYGTYKHMTVYEYLDFYARAYGFKSGERSSRVDEVMGFCDLTSLADRLMDTLSKGMAQRLCLGRTLLHDPDVLILDEPAAGLDPKARVEFKRLLRLLAGEGKTIFISSHILSELGEMCDTLIFIDQGRLIHSGSADSLKRLNVVGMMVWVGVAEDPKKLEQWAMINPGVSVVETTQEGCRLRLDSAEAYQVGRVLKRMVDDGLPVVEFRREDRKLEDAFIAVLEKVGK